MSSYGMKTTLDCCTICSVARIQPTSYMSKAAYCMFFHSTSLLNWEIEFQTNLWGIAMVDCIFYIHESGTVATDSNSVM